MKESIQEEQEIENLEIQFPLLSGKAFSEAREEALNKGLSLVESDDGKLYRVQSDGTRHFIRNLNPPVSISKGKKYLIQ